MGVQESLIETLKGIPGFGDMVKDASGTGVADAVRAGNEAATKTKFVSVLEVAYLIASADGNTSAAELSHIKDNVSKLTSGVVDGAYVDSCLEHAAKQAEAEGRDARIAKVATMLESESDREAAFLIGASAAWTGGGVGTQEGLCMQAIAKAFGWEISHMHQLLGKARG